MLVFDQSDFDAHAAIVEKVKSRTGRIDILVNNAGRSQRALIEETSLQTDMEVFNLNTFGVISITKQVLPVMKQQKSGHIVVVSSLAGKNAAPVSGSYCASKHALQGFFDTLRMEMFQHNIKVTVVCPVREKNIHNSSS